MAISVFRDCVIIIWTLSPEPLSTLWSHLFSCSTVLFLELTIVHIILFVPSFLCTYHKFIPKLFWKYKSAFNTSKHIHYQFHFFLEDILLVITSPLDLWLPKDADPLLSVLQYGRNLRAGGGIILPPTVKFISLSARLKSSNQQALFLASPPLFVNQQLLECVAIRMKPCILVFWVTEHLTSLFRIHKSEFPFYKEIRGLKSINILRKILEGKLQAYF